MIKHSIVEKLGVLNCRLGPCWRERVVDLSVALVAWANWLDTGGRSTVPIDTRLLTPRVHNARTSTHRHTCTGFVRRFRSSDLKSNQCTPDTLHENPSAWMKVMKLQMVDKSHHRPHCTATTINRREIIVTHSRNRVCRDNMRVSVTIPNWLQDRDQTHDDTQIAQLLYCSNSEATLHENSIKTGNVLMRFPSEKMVFANFVVVVVIVVLFSFFLFVIAGSVCNSCL